MPFFEPPSDGCRDRFWLLLIAVVGTVAALTAIAALLAEAVA